MRVFINGFGRIGRSVLRAWMGQPARWPGLEVVGINDIAAPEMCAYLFQYDSVFGPWPGTVALESGALVVNGRALPLYRVADLSSLDLSGVDVVMECTGRADARDVAARGLTAGARRVLVSGPARGADVTVVLGANEAALGGQRRPSRRVRARAQRERGDERGQGGRCRGVRGRRGRSGRGEGAGHPRGGVS